MAPSPSLIAASRSPELIRLGHQRHVVIAGAAAGGAVAGGEDEGEARLAQPGRHRQALDAVQIDVEQDDVEAARSRPRRPLRRGVEAVAATGQPSSSSMSSAVIAMIASSSTSSTRTPVHCRLRRAPPRRAPRRSGRQALAPEVEAGAAGHVGGKRPLDHPQAEAARRRRPHSGPALLAPFEPQPRSAGRWRPPSRSSPARRAPTARHIWRRWWRARAMPSPATPPPSARAPPPARRLDPPLRPVMRRRPPPRSARRASLPPSSRG